MGQQVEAFLGRARAQRTKTLSPEVRNLMPDILPENWSLEDWFEFEERAAILEFDGGYSREQAESLALIEFGLIINGEEDEL